MILLHDGIVARCCRVSSLYTSRVDKSVSRAHHAAMTNDRAPDDATGDSVINAELIARVHVFMAALLTFLGFNVLPTETAFDMLDTLTQWLADAKKIRRDPQGATARIWWDAFKDMWRDDEMTASDCAGNADAAVAEFGKRFLPVAEEDRDTFDTADFEALRVECDRLDANIAILESRADDLQQNLDSIIAERNALLKTNAHHASEISALRAQHEEFVDAICAAIGVSRDGGYDIVRICRDNARDARHYDEAKLEIATLRQERDELKAQLASAIVPLPKPERVAPGQRWLWQTYEPKFLLPKRAVAEQKERNKRGHLSRIGITSNPLHDDNWIYLGTENA